MPAKSAKQERFMQAVANNPRFAKQVGVPQSVGREFTKGDEMKESMKKMMELNPMRMAGKGGRKMGKKAAETVEKKARGGGIEHKGKTKGTMVKMAMGGSVSKRADGIAKRGKTSCKMV